MEVCKLNCPDFKKNYQIPIRKQSRPRVSFLFIIKIWKFTREEKDPGSYFCDIGCDQLFKTADRIKIIGQLMLFHVRREAFRNKRRISLAKLAKIEHIKRTRARQICDIKVPLLRVAAVNCNFLCFCPLVELQ